MPDGYARVESKLELVGSTKFPEQRSRRTPELTRPRGSANFDLQKLLEKHAIAARVQRFVGHRRSKSRGISSGV